MVVLEEGQEVELVLVRAERAGDGHELELNEVRGSTHLLDLDGAALQVVDAADAEGVSARQSAHLHAVLLVIVAHTALDVGKLLGLGKLLHRETCENEAQGGKQPS